MPDDRELSLAEAIRRSVDQLTPAAVSRRVNAGENPVRVWREHRRMTLEALAAAAGVDAADLSAIESGQKDGSQSMMEAIAGALKVDLDDIV
ncbi:helix-turn-helix domain-containing protein [Fodinicurvata sp. EGI_FJ10296]|uniref:helix-turn-helix domain-containing protein n=1 Tax=Fodinicurvata sp. EGI_FJ10296 TaxID=3231908 RepID=UPI0034573516